MAFGAGVRRLGRPLLALAGLGALHASAAEPPKHHRAVQPPGLYRVDFDASLEPDRQPHNFCLQPAAKASCPESVRVIDPQALSYVTNCPSAQSTRTVRRIDDKTWTVHTAMTIKADPPVSVPAASAKERWTRIAATCKP